MTVLVAYATAHGSTRGIAEFIGRRLTEGGGLDVDVRPADLVAGVDGYEAVVGSAVHNGRWLTPATTVLQQIQNTAPCPLWLFSVCTVGETSSFLGPRLSRTARRARKLPPGVAETGAPHRFFAGVISKTQWSGLGRLFFAIARGRYGDQRDWSDIAHWTDGEIIAALTADRPV